MSEEMINRNEERIERAFINRLNNQPEDTYQQEAIDLPF
jgi:hypothetical protein